MPRPVSPVLALADGADALRDTDPAVGLARLLGQNLMQSRPTASSIDQRLGLDFATEDHLGLAGHPTMQALALAETLPSRTHAGQLFTTLHSTLAMHLRLPSVLSFATGTQAICETFAALLSPDDDVLIDSGAHPAMFTAIGAARAGLYRFPSGSFDAVERRLTRLARQPRRGRLIVAVPAVSATGSKVAELAELSALARTCCAILVADVTQDFGAIGQDGGGMMEVQGCLGRVDIVLGSLAKCFAVAGGFAAFRDPALAAVVRQGAEPPLSPTNACLLLKAVDIAFSPEGRSLRRNLQGVIQRLRNHLMADGARVLGAASPFVPILLPPATALPRTALLTSAGPRVRLLQAPEVPLHAPRWRIELKAGHSPADIDDLAELIRDVTRAFDRVPPSRALPSKPLPTP
ncbi:MAG: aminotransferase class I/II-fold pyridoxal phosphate-dependent enzyme [Tabrizicola sp.]|jgi:7-keto-8-aminopelargonate synthetase-like enzyme|nr:aminotransferase class I/II-fold pyridoxal phosphate-dependent enzyme [Tabrizicola sp.]